LAVLSLGARVTSPRQSRRTEFVPPRREINISHQKSMPTQPFWPNWTTKRLITKTALILGFINLIVCPIGEVPTPLNCVKCYQVTVIKLLQGKFKMSPILKNICSGWQIRFVRVIFYGLVCKCFVGSELMTKLKVTRVNHSLNLEFWLGKATS
jgi:hypothetical protein